MTISRKRAYRRAWYHAHKKLKRGKHELFGATFDLSWWRPLHRSRAK